MPGETERRSNTVDLAQALGRVEGTLETIQNTIGEIKETLAPLPVLINTVKRIEPMVDAHEKIKQRGVGYIIAAGVGGGGIGAIFRHTLERIVGG